MTTQEGNKLIAEFLGCQTYEDYESMKYLVPVMDAHAYYAPDLPFAKNWNWLMKVIDKIVAINTKKDKEWYYYTISHNHCRIYANTSFGISWEYATCGDTTINAVYLAVIQFIQWHNQQK